MNYSAHENTTQDPQLPDVGVLCLLIMLHFIETMIGLGSQVFEPNAADGAPPGSRPERPAHTPVMPPPNTSLPGLPSAPPLPRRAVRPCAQRLNSNVARYCGGYRRNPLDSSYAPRRCRAARRHGHCSAQAAQPLSCAAPPLPAPFAAATACSQASRAGCSGTTSS